MYNVSFDPEIDSSRLKNVLLYRISGMLGPTKCFNSMTMLLPLKLPELQDLQGNTIAVKTRCSYDTSTDTIDNKFGHKWWLCKKLLHQFSTIKSRDVEYKCVASIKC